MKHVWVVSDNMDGFDVKIFSSKFNASSYFKEVLKDNDVPLSDVIENREGLYSALYNKDFWLLLDRRGINSN